MPMLNKIFKLKKKEAFLSEEDLIIMSIKEKLKDYQNTHGPSEFSGVLVMPRDSRNDKGPMPKMEFEIVGFDL